MARSRIAESGFSSIGKSRAKIYNSRPIGKSRAAGRGILFSNDGRKQTLNQLLAEMDGFDTHSGVIIMAGDKHAGSSGSGSLACETF